jgi:hypothetical protein
MCVCGVWAFDGLAAISGSRRFPGIARNLVETPD